MDNFDTAFEHVIGVEGGYVNDPRDPGGETKYGISKRAHPKEDIRNMTLARAKAIYREEYWDRVQGDSFPLVVAEALFDAAVNSGPSDAIKWAQAAVGFNGYNRDGKLGPKTRAALLAADPTGVAARMHGWRLAALTEMTRWPTYSKGWSRRVAGLLKRVPIDPQPQAEQPQDGDYEAYRVAVATWLKAAPTPRV